MVKELVAMLCWTRFNVSVVVVSSFCLLHFQLLFAVRKTAPLRFNSQIVQSLKPLLSCGLKALFNFNCPSDGGCSVQLRWYEILGLPRARVHHLNLLNKHGGKHRQHPPTAQHRAGLPLRACVRAGAWWESVGFAETNSLMKGLVLWRGVRGQGLAGLDLGFVTGWDTSTWDTCYLLIKIKFPSALIVFAFQHEATCQK